jgi:restriction endonuclease S subunit
MKKEWPTKRLGDVCQIIMGQSPDGDSYNTTGEGVPLINGPVEFSETSFGKTIRSKFTTAPTKFCREGDLILCVRGSTTGRMNIAGFDACVGRGVAAIRATQYQPWINHFINWKRDEIHGKGTGATFPNVSGVILANFELVVPPLPEQHRIVGILDEAFEGIATAKANAEKNLQNAHALFESYLQSVFTQRGDGWGKRKLSELYSFKNGINFDKTQKIGRGILTIDVLNMYGDDLQVGLNNLYRVNKEVSGEYILKDGDFLVVRSSVKREGVGWAAVFQTTSEPITFCGFIIRGRPLAKMNPEYAVYFLRCRATRDELIRRSTQSTITNINQFNFGELIIPVPSLLEQKEIVCKLSVLREKTLRLESLYERKLAALDELKKSLLDRAFTGQL